MHLGSVFVNNQLDAQFFFRTYLFQFCTCFEHPCAHHQESFINTTSGIRGMSLYVGDRLVCRFGWSSVLCSKYVLVKKWNNYVRKKSCASSWLFTRIASWICTVLDWSYIQVRRRYNGQSRKKGKPLDRISAQSWLQHIKNNKEITYVTPTNALLYNLCVLPFSLLHYNTQYNNVNIRATIYSPNQNHNLKHYGVNFFKFHYVIDHVV